MKYYVLATILLLMSGVNATAGSVDDKIRKCVDLASSDKKIDCLTDLPRSATDRIPQPWRNHVIAARKAEVQRKEWLAKLKEYQARRERDRIAKLNAYVVRPEMIKQRQLAKSLSELIAKSLSELTRSCLLLSKEGLLKEDAENGPAIAAISSDVYDALLKRCGITEDEQDDAEGDQAET